MGSATQELNSVRAASSVASAKSGALKQDSETVRESLDRNVRFGRVCCGQSQGLSAEVSKEQGVRTGKPGRGTPTLENQGVRAVTVVPGSTVQGVPVRKDQGVTKAGDQEAELPRTSKSAPNSEESNLYIPGFYVGIKNRRGGEEVSCPVALY